MPRSEANYDRESDYIIPPFVYIVATEGETEQDYFNKFRDNYPNKLIKLLFVPKEGENKTNSSPKHVFKYLSAFDKEYIIRKDQNKKLWQLLDRDRWRDLIGEAYENCKKINTSLFYLIHVLNYGFCYTLNQSMISLKEKELISMKTRKLVEKEII